jgi:hypothetical protein
LFTKAIKVALLDAALILRSIPLIVLILTKKSLAIRMAVKIRL